MKDPHYIVGRVYLRDKKPIYIVSGSYIGGYGGVSNYWSWRRVKKDGTLGVLNMGYGEIDIEAVECEIKIEIRIKK